MGIKNRETVGTLSAPDYRVVYVRLDRDEKLCAEAPADAVAQFASTFGAKATAHHESAKEWLIGSDSRQTHFRRNRHLFNSIQLRQLPRDGQQLLVGANANLHVTCKFAFG